MFYFSRKLGNDVTETLRYMTILWNAIDQQYARLKSPKIQIVVNGVIIANVRYCIFLRHKYLYLNIIKNKLILL